MAETVSLPGLIGSGPARVRPGCRCGWKGKQEFSMTGDGIKEAILIASAHVAEKIAGEAFVAGPNPKVGKESVPSSEATP